MRINKGNLAYLVGVALGDSNLSNPNGRAVRLRVTCDTKYDRIMQNIISAIQLLLPQNKISITKRKPSCVDISCYSNKWESFLGWKAKAGSKEKQKVSVPEWILKNKTYSKKCLRGLFETDGSIYTDRKYLMANFVTIIPALAENVMAMIASLGFEPNMQKFKSKNGKIKHTVRISKNTEKFVKLIGINKD